MIPEAIKNMGFRTKVTYKNIRKKKQMHFTRPGADDDFSVVYNLVDVLISIN